MSILDAGLAQVDFTEVLRALDKLEAAATVRLGQALAMAAVETTRHAKQNHDYIDRTGRLTASIRPGAVTGTFGTGIGVDMMAGARGVTYAAHVEWGTRPHGNHPGTRAYRYMANAIEARLVRTEELLEQAMQLAIEESGLG